MVDWLFPALHCHAAPPLLSSTARALRAWADLEALTCSCAWLGAAQCRAAFALVKKIACDFHQRPVVVAAVLLSCSLLLVAVLWGALLRAIRYHTARRGSAFVRCSLVAIRELRAQSPSAYPPAPHCWTAVADRTAPMVVCYTCAKPVQGPEWQSCEYCGVVVHPRCSRYVPHDCRPMAVRSDRAMHDWKPAGVLMPLVQIDSAQSLSQDAGSSSSSSSGSSPCLELCSYCQEPCELGLFAMEPVWSCSCCHSMAHMRCCVERHPTAFSASTKAVLKAHLAGLETEMASQVEGGTFSTAGSPLGSPRQGAYMVRGMSLHDDLPALGASVSYPRLTPQPSGGGAAAPGAAATSAAASPDGPPAFASELRTKLAVLEERQAPEPESPAAAPATPAAWARSSAAAPPSSYPLDGDTCGMGPAYRVVLPNTAVRSVKAPALLALPAWAGAGSRAAAKGGGAAAAAAVRGAAAPASAPKRLLKKWFRQRSKAPQDRWSPYRLDPEAVPPGTRPLLVFVNLKSGPQVGATMKRQLLQLLHPLQVVELPRESPEPALRLFSALPSTRLLVIGGDGTAAWVLSCIDALGQELGAGGAGGGASSPGGAGPGAWQPPPMAVLPMGTGNDLARCLNWGGGVRHLQRTPLPALLEEVALAAVPTQLDRWNVQFTARDTAAPRRPRLKQLFKKRGAAAAAAAAAAAELGPGGRSASGGSSPQQQRAAAAAATAGSSAGAVAGAATVVKVMNNYVGIGVDAKVALEFHQIRDNYPSFFQSQFGNKMWYTGVGMQDLIRRSCVGLNQRLTLVCDGVEVPLPPDAEGLVILNIGCHMGGVALWDTGLPAPQLPGAAAAAVCAERRHSLHDEVLEVVAIGGVLHMGRLAVGLSRGQRLCQGSSVTVVTKETLPMQVDGEPWMQAATEMRVSLRGKGLVLRRLPANSPAARMSSLVMEVLELGENNGTISAAQKRYLSSEISARLAAADA